MAEAEVAAEADGLDVLKAVIQRAGEVGGHGLNPTNQIALIERLQAAERGVDAAVNAALDRVVRRIEVGDAGLTWHRDKAQVVRIVNETRPKREVKT